MSEVSIFVSLEIFPVEFPTSLQLGSSIYSPFELMNYMCRATQEVFILQTMEV